MRLKKIISQHRRDFNALYECEHCGDTHEGSGYDDSYFHNNIVPNLECVKCGKKSDSTYRPLAARYADNMIV